MHPRLRFVVAFTSLVSLATSQTTLTLATNTAGSSTVAYGTNYVAQYCCSGYAVSAWYIYRAIAPPGYQITNIYLIYAGVEANWDYCVVRNAAVTSWSSTASVLKAYSANSGAVSFGPYVGNYGGVVQFDLYSDSSNTNTGCRWTFGVSVCPIGSYCATGGSAATVCPAGTYGASIGLSTSGCSGVCAAGWFCPPGSTTSTAVICPAGSFCVTSTGSPTLCPAGTYGSTTGLVTSACSGPCPCCGVGATTRSSDTCSQTASITMTATPSPYIFTTLTLSTAIASSTVTAGNAYMAQLCCSYAVNSWYIYRATAPAGYRITNIYLTYAGVEASYDYCVVRNAAVSAWSSTASVLKAYSANTGTVSFGPYAGNYGGVVQFDLYSDYSNTKTGCKWTFGVSACPTGSFCASGSTLATICPVGSFCAAGSGSPTLCPAGTFGSTTGLTTSECSGTCPCCGAGATAMPSGTCSQTATTSVASSIAPSTRPSMTPSVSAHAASSAVPSAIPYASATPPGSVLGVDVLGSDLRSFVVSDPFACYAACSSTPGCTSWAWGLPDPYCAGDYPNTCYLKSSSSPTTVKPCRLWGLPMSELCSRTTSDAVLSLRFFYGPLSSVYNGVAFTQQCAACHSGYPVYVGTTVSGLRYIWYAAAAGTWDFGAAVDTTRTSIDGYESVGVLYPAGAPVTSADVSGSLFIQCGVLGQTPATPALSCAATYAAYGTSAQGVATWVQPLGVSAPYVAFCADGGWTLALQTAGSSSLFAYDSGFWTNGSLLNPNVGTLSAGQEALLQPFNDTQGSAIRLVFTDAMTGARGSSIVFMTQFPSLRALFSGNYTGPGDLAPSEWHAGFPGGYATYQLGCTVAGVNVVTGSGAHSFAYRLGIVTGATSDCAAPDTGMGIGARINYVDSDGYMLPVPVVGQFVGCMSSDLPCFATLGSPPTSRTLAASLYVMGSLGAPAVRASTTSTISGFGNSTFASSTVGIIVIALIVACSVGFCALALILICCCGFAVPGLCCIRSIFPPPLAVATFPLSTGTVLPWLPFAPDSALRWQLVRIGQLPIDVVPFEVGIDFAGRSVYVARARLADGSLRIGRVSRSASFKHGCRVAYPSKVISVDTFEVLVGAAPGFNLRILPWQPGQPPPPGAVVAGVSARGDPLLATVAALDIGGRRCVFAGYASVRESLAVVAVDDVVKRLPCAGVLTAVPTTTGHAPAAPLFQPSVYPALNSYAPAPACDGDPVDVSQLPPLPLPPPPAYGGYPTIAASPPVPSAPGPGPRAAHPVVYRAGLFWHDGGRARAMRRGPAPPNLDAVVDWSRYVAGADIAERTAAGGTAGPWDPAYGFVSNADYVGAEGTDDGPRGGSNGGAGGQRGVRVHPSNGGAGGGGETGVSGACDPSGPADTRVYDCGGT